MKRNYNSWFISAVIIELKYICGFSSYFLLPKQAPAIAIPKIAPITSSIIFICIYVCMYICMYVCIYVYIF